MAEWVTPVTTWTKQDRFTYVDMNRIAGNLNYLWYKGDATLSNAIREDYTRDDIVTLAEWKRILKYLNILCVSTGLQVKQPNTSVTASNINRVEKIEAMLKKHMKRRLNQKKANNWVSSDKNDLFGDYLYESGPGATRLRGL